MILSKFLASPLKTAAGGYLSPFVLLSHVQPESCSLPQKRLQRCPMNKGNCMQRRWGLESASKLLKIRFSFLSCSSLSCSMVHIWRTVRTNCSVLRRLTQISRELNKKPRIQNSRGGFAFRNVWNEGPVITGWEPALTEVSRQALISRKI